MPENTGQPDNNAANSAKSLIGLKLGGKYTLLGELGGGGLGKVYKAQQVVGDRLVAIKLLPLSLARDQVVVKRLAREGKALGRLSHPNIVGTYDFGFSEKGEPYLVLELVQGETLQARLDRLGPMPFAECLPIFIQICNAMNYAHANGIVHRDIKPMNMMLVQKANMTVVKILDFGIAQMESENQKLTQSGEVWGSPHYMSPEQCTAGVVDHLTDIYSFGILMYAALSNRLPHTGTEFSQVVSQKLFEPIPGFAILDLPQPIDVPLGLERIVFKCLQRQPADRYQSMGEVELALETFAKQAGVSLPDVNAKDKSGPGDNVPTMRQAVIVPLGKGAYKNSRLLPAALVIVVMLIIVTIVMLVGKR